MAKKEDLPAWVTDALKSHGGAAKIAQIARDIWESHEKELRGSGDLFYTWQYDMRWAANYLRRKKTLKSVEMSPKGVWELA